MQKLAVCKVCSCRSWYSSWLNYFWPLYPSATQFAIFLPLYRPVYIYSFRTSLLAKDGEFKICGIHVTLRGLRGGFQ